MQKLERNKPYKNTSPLVTINRIRQILFDNDIFVIESAQRIEPVTGVCSCRLILGDEGLRELDIGSNGKGMDAKYALASAYAEFVERLQNGATLWKICGIPDSVPGAVEVNREEYEKAARCLLHMAFGESAIDDKMFSRIVGKANNKVIVFKEYTSKESVCFPAKLYNIMTGSNGMAAGNTVLEATIQGLSEVFERAALQKLFLNQITPPTIDEALFEGTEVLNRLRELKRYGISFRILDCSINQKLPVIGLLLEKKQKYHIHFGADPSPITALERCLTETFQGRLIEELPLYEPLSKDEGLLTLYDNEKKEFTDSTGRVPIWIVDGEPTYSFEGFEHPITISDEDDMNYYMDILNHLGKKLYIWESDILGFPTVRIYVPGMTENHCFDITSCLEKPIPKNISHFMKRLPLLNDAKYEALAQSVKIWLRKDFGINEAEDFPTGEFLGLKFTLPVGTFPGKYWEDRLIVAAIYLRGGISEQGSELLEICIKDGSLSTSNADLLRIRLKSKLLTFTPTEWPECPNCDNCGARQKCFQSEVNGFALKLSALLRL